MLQQGVNDITAWVDGLGTGYGLSNSSSPLIFESGEIPPWMSIAINEIGVSQIDKETNSARIIEYFNATNLKGQSGTKSYGWCSAFANWVMTNAGYTGTNDGKAKSWLNWGTELTAPKYGAITVTYKYGQYHVGFYAGLGAKSGTINLLGGNQTDQVMYQKYYYYESDVVRYAWPNP